MGTHKWKFRPRFRTNGYGWSGSTLAAKRLREALSEIKTVHRKDPALAGEGAVILMEKIWPAFQHIDTSSGALGSAVYKAVHTLVDLLVRIDVDDGTREKWLERLWTAVKNDGVDYLAPVRERWGELCVTPERASQYADTFLPGLRRAWSDSHHGYFLGEPACLSCLLKAERYEELLELIDQAQFVWWHYRQYGFPALGDLIATTPSAPGKWFATAKTFGYLDLAGELAHQSPVQIGTLLRAAREYEETSPEFTFQVAQAALKWLHQGEFYEITGTDVIQARQYALSASDALGLRNETETYITQLADDPGTDSFVSKFLRL